MIERAGLPQASDLRTLIDLVRRRRWTVILTTFLVVGVAVGLSVRQTPIYESTATVQVNPLDPDQVLNGFGYAFLYTMQNEVTIASSPGVAERAAFRVEKSGGPREETGSLSVENPVDTTSVVFTYADPSAEAARMWAQAYAQAYVKDRQARAMQAYLASTNNLQSQIADARERLLTKQDQLSSAPAEDRATLQSEANSLLTQIGQLQARLATIPQPYEGATDLVAPAYLPTSPSSPQPLRTGLLALLIGLGLGAGAALVRERLDDRTIGKRDMEAEIGAPVLGIVPSVEGWRRRNVVQLVSRDAPKTPAAEAYRSVRTNIQFLGQTEDVKVIAVTSGSLGEGKSTTSANLAIALVQAGLRVIAVSADLRKPRLHEFFGIDNVDGLSDLLEENIGVGTAAHRCGYDNLLVIPSGPVPLHPAELVTSARMGRLVTYLRGAADFVIIDTPPVLAVADTLSIARMVDGVIVVADARSTTRAAMAHVREQLEQVGARIVGGVYNNFDLSKNDREGRYYGYGGYSERHDKASDRSREPAARTGFDEPQDIWS
jgi:capsular exopolysaccharide synthesis family protein